MHISVLLNESIEYLNILEDGIYVDATLGYAGHSSKILSKLKNGKLYAFDQDSEAISHSDNLLKGISNNYKIIKSNFVNIKSELAKLGVDKVDGILYDLGVSSPQLDEDYRGFSFHKDAFLDMRMDTSSLLTAYEVVNTYSLEKLIKIFKEYGEEEYAVSIAKAIVKYREEKEIKTTLELVDIIDKSVPFKYKRDHHPARKVFQAIRIEVNDELNVFEKSLKDALDLLNVGGRICVITFHSLEDKICKEIMKEATSIPAAIKKLPVIPKEYEAKYKMVKVIEPSLEETLKNPRSRSAKLRVIERIG